MLHLEHIAEFILHVNSVQLFCDVCNQNGNMIFCVAILFGG